MKKRQKERFVRDNIAVGEFVYIPKDTKNKMLQESTIPALQNIKYEIIVPMPSADDIHRWKVWEFCKREWIKLCSMPIVEAEPVIVDGLYHKSATLNAAIMRSAADYVIIADADIVPTREILNCILIGCTESKDFIMPHKMVKKMTREQTECILYNKQSSDSTPAEQLTIKQGMPCGGLLIARRQALIDIGLYDKQLIGWGGEDYGLSLRIGNRLHKSNETLVHLWHEPQLQKNITSKENMRLINQKHKTKTTIQISRKSKTKTIWIGNTRHLVDDAQNDNKKGEHYDKSL
jgi:hypothetical protein